MLKVRCVKNKDGSVSVFMSTNDEKEFCRFNKYHSLKPDYRHKKITLNCFTYMIEWIK